MEQPSAVVDSSTPIQGTATPPAPVTQSNGTTSTTPPTPGDGGSQTEAAAPGESTFTSTDPNSLPPELKSKYDSMLGDYKKKTAEIAAQRREYEAALEKARIADMITADPDMVNLWNQKYGQQQQPEQVQQDQYVDPVLKKEVDVLKANLLVKDFKASHPDFDELDKDSLITGYIQLNPPKTEKEWGNTLEKAYKYAAGLKTRWIEEGKKQGLQRVSEKAEQAALPPSSSTQNTFTGDPSKLSVSEAFALAKKGIRVGR